MKRIALWTLINASLLAGLCQTGSLLRAQEAALPRYPLLTREALAGRDPAEALQVSDPVGTGPLPAQIRNLPDVNAKLKVVHRRSQLIVAKSNVVRAAIADPSVVDVVQYSPSELAIIGMNLGATTVTLWFDDGSEPLIYLVETIRDPSLEERRKVDYGKLEKKIAELFPNSKVYLTPMSGKIIVRGQARDSREAALILNLIAGEVISQTGSLAGPQPLPNPGLEPTGLVNPNNLAASFIVNMLDVPGEFQVLLRVKIAELNRSMLRKMGVNFAALINDGQQFFSSALTSAVAAGAGAAANAPLSGVFSSGDVAILINALRANGTAKILSEPAITVLSGHPASFLSGGEFAVPTIVGIGGAAGQQTSFRGFGTSLIVTPTVLDKDVIRLQILPEFSQVSNSNAVNGIPGVNTRRVQTTIELREGQTIALAGLISHQSRAETANIPYLGEIPVIGPLLFSAKNATQDELELIILVTPEIVRPMDADEVPPVPGHEVTHPDDCQLYWHNMTEGAPDQKVYQLAPYGHGAGYGEEVGYTQYNPQPANPGYHPAQTSPFAAPALGPMQGNRYPGGVNPAQRRPTPIGAGPVPQGVSPRGLAPSAGPSASRGNGIFGTRTASYPGQQAGGYVAPRGNTRNASQTSYQQGGYQQPGSYQPAGAASAGGYQQAPGGHTLPRARPTRYYP